MNTVSQAARLAFRAVNLARGSEGVTYSGGRYSCVSDPTGGEHTHRKGVTNGSQRMGVIFQVAADGFPTTIKAGEYLTTDDGTKHRIALVERQGLFVRLSCSPVA